VHTSFDTKLSSQLSIPSKTRTFDYSSIFFKSFVSIIGPYTALKDLLLLSFNNSEKGASLWYHSSFLRKGVVSLYPFLYTSNTLIGKYIKRNKKGINSFYAKKKYSLKDLRTRYFSIGTDFLSEFPSLSSKILSGVSGYIVSRDAFFLGLLPYKKKNVFFNYKKGLGVCTLIDILEGRSTLCKNISKNLNSFLFFSMIVKRRFDGDFLQSFSNSISFIKNANGVLSSISSETSSCEISSKNTMVLKNLGSLETSSFYSLDKVNNLFQLEKNSLNLNLFTTLKNNIVLSVGEISEKVTHTLLKSPVFLWVYLSNFNSRNTTFKIFFLEESFDFLSTLGSYKKIFWSPLGSTGSQFNLNSLLQVNEEISTGFKNFILNSNENSLKSNLRAFPIYLNKNYIYLTEIKTLSKENLFQEDTFLKKSPRLIKLISFFRLSHSSFKN
jgi:hypothetical protein